MGTILNGPFFACPVIPPFHIVTVIIQISANLPPPSWKKKLAGYIRFISPLASVCWRLSSITSEHNFPLCTEAASWMYFCKAILSDCVGFFFLSKDNVPSLVLSKKDGIESPLGILDNSQYLISLHIFTSWYLFCACPLCHLPSLPMAQFCVWFCHHLRGA